MARSKPFLVLFSAMLGAPSLTALSQMPVQQGKLIADDGSAPSLITCWYNEQKQTTGAGLRVWVYACRTGCHYLPETIA